MMSLRRRIMMANQKNDWYVTDGLLMHLDGIKNTRHGHDETTSVWEDLSDNNLDIQLYNCGILEKSVLFDGSTSYGIGIEEETSKIAIPNGKAQTIEIVMKYLSLDDFIVFISNKNKAFGYHNKTNRLICGTIKFNTASHYALIDKVYGYRIDYVLNDTNCVVFENGVKLNNALDGYWDTQTSDNNFIIGKRFSGNHLNGEIFAIRIYDHILSDAEKAHNYNIDKKRFGIT